MNVATLPRLTDRRTLAGALRISPFCLGLVSDAAVVPAAFDAGINFFFVSCDLHWPLYAPLRQGLHQILSRDPSIRDEIVIAATTYMVHPTFALAPPLELAGVLGVDHIDVLVAGGCYDSDWQSRIAKLRGRARAVTHAAAIGGSFHSRAGALDAIDSSAVDLAFVRYNPRHPGAATDLFPRLPAGRDALVYTFKSMVGRQRALARRLAAEGHWLPSDADYYRYALGHPAVDGVLLSVNSERELVELDQAMARGPLAAAERQYLEHLADLGDAQAPPATETRS